MSAYPRDKVLGMPEDRQLQLLLNTICEIEKSWPNTKNEKESFFRYWEWLELSPSAFFKLRLRHLKPKDNDELRAYLNIAVAIERKLGKNPDELGIRTQDTRRPRKTEELFVVLDHLRSAFNVGSVFRSSECLGVKHIYLVGYTPTPDDPRVQKTAMGTEKLVSWSQHQSLSEVLNILKAQKAQVLAFETVAGAKSLNDLQVQGPTAILLGNERFGLQAQDLETVDEVVEIPMWGQKNSLNVATSFGIAAYQLGLKLRQGRDL